MPSFECPVCGASFELPDATLARFPGWKPRFCREHSPKRAGKAPGKGGVRGGGGRRGKGVRPGPGSGAREENLTLAQVLQRYDGGPRDGVFTDGSSVPNPGPGGWGVVWVEDGAVRDQRWGHEPRTTSNRMELTALIEAFKLLPEDAEVVVRTDSRLCVDTITKWAPGWEKRGWKRKDGAIKNLELVQELVRLVRAHPRCRLEWIASHAGHRWNEYADSLSTAWMRDTP